MNCSPNYKAANHHKLLLAFSIELQLLDFNFFADDFIC